MSAKRCDISLKHTFIVQMIVASLLAAIAFRLNNQGVLTGSMLISPIGGIVLKAALHNTKDLFSLSQIYIPFLVGTAAGFLPGSGVTKTLQNSGVDVTKNPSSLIDASVIATTCGILFPMLRKVPEVGVDIATQILPPIVAVGYCLSLSVRKKLPWQSAFGCLLLFIVYFVCLFVSTRVTHRVLCRHKTSD